MQEQGFIANSDQTVAPVIESGVPSYTAQVEGDLGVSVNDDLSSDTDDIREQAASSRDPEEGKNIL